MNKKLRYVGIEMKNVKNNNIRLILWLNKPYKEQLLMSKIEELFLTK